jgi:hypothetical protein
MGEFILSFDTEDLANRGAADDAILQLATILAEEGVKGCFNIVSSLIGILKEAGRQDVLDALRRHEISSHSRRHTWHPTPPEVAEQLSWNDAFAWSVEQQGTAIEEIKREFGLPDVMGYIVPGNTFAAPDIAALRLLGVKVYSGSMFKNTNGVGMWFGGMLNLEEKIGLDRLLIEEGIEGVRQHLPEWKAARRTIFCLHPNFIPHSVFWDAGNLNGANRVQWGRWNQTALRDPELVERVFNDFREAVRLFKKEMVPASFRSILAMQPVRPALRREWMPGLIEQSSARLLHASRGSSTWSAAELLRAAAWFLHSNGAQVEARYMDGLHAEPSGIDQPVELSEEQVRSAAWEVSEAGFVPSSIDVSGISIGPRDYLEAAGQVLAGAKTVKLSPKAQLADIEGVYRFDKLNLSGWMYPEGWVGKKAMRQLHYMMWTFRPEYAQDAI